MVEKARKPTQLQLQGAFGRLYSSERAMQFTLLPPRPSPEEAESLSAPNKGALRELQEACRHNATLVQGVFKLTELLMQDVEVDKVRLSQLCADLLTYGFGAHEELLRRMKDIVRGSISSRFTPVEEFRYPDAFRPLDVLTEAELKAARKDRGRAREDKARSRPAAPPAKSTYGGGGGGSGMKRSFDKASNAAKKQHGDGSFFGRGEPKSGKDAAHV